MEIIGVLTLYLLIYFRKTGKLKINGLRFNVIKLRMANLRRDA